MLCTNGNGISTERSKHLSHSPSDGRDCHARCQPSHQEDSVSCPRILGIQPDKPRIWTSDLPITGQPALPPGLQPPNVREKVAPVGAAAALFCVKWRTGASNWENVDEIKCDCNVCQCHWTAVDSVHLYLHFLERAFFKFSYFFANKTWRSTFFFIFK